MRATALSVLLAACSVGGPTTRSDAGEIDARPGTPDARPPVDAAAPVDARADAAPGIDAAPTIDARPIDAATVDAAVTPDAAPPADGGGSPYRHTIVIDGVNDFAAGDTFTTTSSPTYAAYVTWDAVNLYLGYSGPDIDDDTTDKKWVLVYIDVDTTSAGATRGVRYNTQDCSFPTGMVPDYHLQWKTNNAYLNLRGPYDSGAGEPWPISATVPGAYQLGPYVELSIPWTALGSPASAGIVTYMVNETSTLEGSYAGLYTGNFTDGYFDYTLGGLPLGKYLHVDRSSTVAPNSAANVRP